MTYKTGKLPAIHDARTLMFAKYKLAGLPLAPASYNSIDRVGVSLGTSDVPTLFPMDGNDQYADCGFAAGAHLQTNFAGLVGIRRIASTDEVVQAYLKFTGGQDSGVILLHVLKEWRKNGIMGHQIPAFTSLHRADADDVKNAILLFGGIYLGFQVQTNAIPDFEAGKLWEPGGTDGDGHCVVSIAYRTNEQGGLELGILTWGGMVWASWDWWNQMVDEAYGILPPEAQNSAFDPGYDYAALQRDLLLLAA